MSFFITRHARVRMQQRGIKHTRLASVLEYADLSNPVSRHLSAIRVSKRAVQEAIADGVDPQEMKRAFRMVVINSVDGALVTCANVHGRKAKNYTRRERQNYWKD